MPQTKCSIGWIPPNEWKEFYPMIERIVAEKNKKSLKEGFEFMVSESRFEEPIFIWVGVTGTINNKNDWFSKLFRIHVSYFDKNYVISVDRLSPDRVPYEIKTSREEFINSFQKIVDSFNVKNVKYVKTYDVTFSGGEKEESAEYSIGLNKDRCR
jgi:hypothetical protein